MTRKRRLWAAIAGVAVLAGAAWPLASWLLAPPVIPLERAYRVRAGMTVPEVEAALGYTPHTRQGLDAEWVADTLPPRASPTGNVSEHYAVSVRVRYDDEGRVADKSVKTYTYCSLSVETRAKVWVRAALAGLGL